ncbi:unnamed protein product [Penicillium nalgiovense]|nr:unnamed protein product [Penicillium nalgiovense]
MHQSKGHSSSLVLTIRKLNLWELTRVALITLHYRQCSTQSHGLHTIPSPVASNNAACPRWKIANQDSESTTGCGDSSASLVASKLEASVLPDSELSRLLLRRSTPSSTVKYTVASGLFPQIEDKTKVAADERAPSRLPPSSPPPSHYCGVLNLWHRDTFIHHGSAMFIASGFVTRVYCLNKLSCASQGGFFEASADCDELECDVAWLVTALQRVVSDLVVKPI